MPFKEFQSNIDCCSTPLKKKYVPRTRSHCRASASLVMSESSMGKTKHTCHTTSLSEPKIKIWITAAPAQAAITKDFKLIFSVLDIVWLQTEIIFQYCINLQWISCNFLHTFVLSEVWSLKRINMEYLSIVTLWPAPSRKNKPQISQIKSPHQLRNNYNL